MFVCGTFGRYRYLTSSKIFHRLPFALQFLNNTSLWYDSPMTFSLGA